MSSSFNNRRRSLLAAAAVVLALLTGCSDQGGETGTAAVPHSSPLASSTVGVAQSPLHALDLETDPLSVMPESHPVSISIPAAGTDSVLIELGLNDDGTVEVPSTEPGAPAGWYISSPTPGERGPSILLGHVNATDSGPGVFAGLREMTAGDVINVMRADGSVAVFRFTEGHQYSKSNFPSDLVYGDTPGAELRLITCDGYNPGTGEFDDNYVVYAELVDSL